MKFDSYDIDNAPEASRQDMRNAEKSYGTNLYLLRGLAASPAALKAYLAIAGALREYGNLSPVEQQVVYITVSAENGCTYCVAAHSTMAVRVKMADDVRNALREQRPLPDAKLDALRNFTLSVMKHKGFVPPADLAAFEAAGFDQAHVLDVLTILAQKTISNYYNHMAEPPLDAMFQAQQWQRPAQG